jgi:hypothetical protein
VSEEAADAEGWILDAVSSKYSAFLTVLIKAHIYLNIGASIMNKSMPP